MKTPLCFLCFLCLLLLILPGCIVVPRGDIQVAKATVFGLDISYDAASVSPHVRLGLVRYFYQRVPTSTNTIYAPDYSSSVSADIRPLSQTVVETFATGAGATNNPVRYGNGATNGIVELIKSLK